jgi:nucleotide-binding universal stress UspA family protein
VIENRKAQLSELLADIDSPVEADIEVRSGQVEGSIVAFASDCSADLIVVGAPNRSWLEALFNPSIASGITKSAPCPVLVVPEPG